VLKRIDEEVVRAQLQRVFDSGIRSLAVVFMHSYMYASTVTHARLQ